MGILGKDMFDMDRMYTNTRVEFGAAGYWVEEKVYPLPYGFVLTEILNMDVTPFQEALDELESVISQSHTEAVLGTFFNTLKWFGRLPLYRTYLYRERVCQDDFCKFSKFKYLSAEKSPNISCLHIS